MRSLLNAAVAGSGLRVLEGARGEVVALHASRRCVGEAAQELWKGLDSDTRNRRER